jgi:hypothetical protein
MPRPIRQAQLRVAGFRHLSHLFGELIKQRTGIEIVHVPYRGATPAIADLPAGQVQMFVDNLRNVQSFIQAGRLRALAVTSEKRHPEMPDLPTMAEAGVPGVVGFYWNGVLAPAGTPQPIIDRLNTVINDGLRTREGQATITRLGMEPRLGSPQDFAKLIAQEHQYWAAVARAAISKLCKRNLLSSPRRRRSTNHRSFCLDRRLRHIAGCGVWFRLAGTTRYEHRAPRYSRLEPRRIGAEMSAAAPRNLLCALDERPASIRRTDDRCRAYVAGVDLLGQALQHIRVEHTLS